MLVGCGCSYRCNCKRVFVSTAIIIIFAHICQVKAVVYVNFKF